MNLIENWFSKKHPVKIERIITEDELYFKVSGIDGYGGYKEMKTMFRETAEKMANGNYTWVE